MRYIHCLPCGNKRRAETGAEEPGERSWFVGGFARRTMLCDSCNARINKGQKCQATTFYTDDAGYRPWEGEYLDRLGRGASGAERAFRQSTPSVKVLTVLACRGRSGGFRWKVPEVEMTGHADGEFESLSEQVHDQFSCHDWLGVQFEEDLGVRGGRYEFDVHLVGAAEFGPAYADDEFCEVWED